MEVIGFNSKLEMTLTNQGGELGNWQKFLGVSTDNQKLINLSALHFLTSFPTG